MGIDLGDHTAIVTGAGRGIGREIALQFAAAGADVVVAARTENEVESVAGEATGHGVGALAVPTDLSRVEDIDALIDATIEEFGTPTVLINNAGANHPNLPAEQTLEEVETMIDVNFQAVFLLSVRFAETFRSSDAGDGRIITISSISGPRGNPSMTLYGGTKTGVYGLTKGLAAEYARDGITANTIFPVTTMVERVKRVIEEHDRYDLTRIPMGRAGDPKDVADVCLCLASDYQVRHGRGHSRRRRGGDHFRPSKRPTVA